MIITGLIISGAMMFYGASLLLLASKYSTDEFVGPYPYEASQQIHRLPRTPKELWKIYDLETDYQVIAQKYPILVLTDWKKKVQIRLFDIWRSLEFRQNPQAFIGNRLDNINNNNSEGNYALIDDTVTQLLSQLIYN